MKTILLILLIAISSYLNAQNIGYKVVIEQTLINKSKCVKTTNINLVEQMYFNKFKCKIKVNELLSGKITYFRHENNNIVFYCEKMNVIKKRNGNVTYRKIKKLGKSRPSLKPKSKL